MITVSKGKIYGIVIVHRTRARVFISYLVPKLFPKIMRVRVCVFNHCFVNHNFRNSSFNHLSFTVFAGQDICGRLSGGSWTNNPLDIISPGDTLRWCHNLLSTEKGPLKMSKKVLFELSTEHFQADDLIAAFQLSNACKECPSELSDGDFFYALAVLTEYIDALEVFKDNIITS